VESAPIRADHFARWDTSGCALDWITGGCDGPRLDVRHDPIHAGKLSALARWGPPNYPWIGAANGNLRRRASPSDGRVSWGGVGAVHRHAVDLSDGDRSVPVTAGRTLLIVARSN